MNTPKNLNIDRVANALASPQWTEAGLEECPDPRLIWEAACGDLASAELAEIADHAAWCAVCCHDLQAAREMAEELGEIKPISAREPVSVKRTRPRWKPLIGLIYWISGKPSIAEGSTVIWRPAVASSLFASAATAMLMIAIMPVQHHQDSFPQPDHYRNQATQIVHLLIPDGQILTRDRLALRWQGLEGARYDVHVMTTNLDEIAVVADLSTSELRLSENELAGLEAGTVLLWRVEAYLPDGRRISSLTSSVRLQ